MWILDFAEFLHFQNTVKCEESKQQALNSDIGVKNQKLVFDTVLKAVYLLFSNFEQRTQNYCDNAWWVKI